MSDELQLNKILENSKEFELIAIKHDPMYNDLIIGIEIVKKFIIDNKLIIYGGSSIDYALRLKGDNIYPDNMLIVPDLDFYSPDNAEHAYKLADILYTRGYKEARTINAMHMKTMRVDLGSNHFIADITFCPKIVFDILPYLEYNDMRIIHPIFQRIDIHSSLSFPYDDVPKEVIFARWSKDIKRFNKLDKHYKIVIKGEPLPLQSVTIDMTFKKYVFTGFLAYAMIYKHFIKLVENNKNVKNITKSNLHIDTTITFDALESMVEIVHFDIKKASDELSLDSVFYEPYIHLMPERCEGLKNQTKICVLSTKRKLLSVNSIKFGENTFRVVNVQYLMKYFLAKYFMNLHNDSIKSTYLTYYTSLLEMIQIFDSIFADSDETFKEQIKNSPLFPSVKTYGNENISLSREVALSYLEADLYGKELYKIPRNYYPDRSLERGLPHPKFDPADIEFFREEGKIIKN